MIPWLWVLWSCAGPQEEAGPLTEASLKSWPEDPAAMWAACEAEAFPELADMCWIQAASRLAAGSEAPRARQACARVQDRQWSAECLFQAAEGIAASGALGPALDACQGAGQHMFACLEHVVGFMPRPPGPGPGAEETAVIRAMDAAATTANRALSGAPAPIRARAHTLVQGWRARAIWVGTGAAQPRPADSRHPAGVHLRTAFTQEAARLLAAEDPPRADPKLIVDVWAGRGAPLTGPATPLASVVGCLPLADRLEPGRGEALAPTWGNGWRVTSDDPTEDATVAALEASFWAGAANGATFAGFVDDPSARIAGTAVRLLRHLPREDRAAADALSAATTHPDPRVREQAARGFAAQAERQRVSQCTGPVPGRDPP